MSDPKSDTGGLSDKEAVETLKDVEDATVIDADPAGESGPKSVFSSRTKVIGILIVLLLLSGGVAAALYPLWQDHAENFVEQNGIPVTVPEVPENGFYGMVSDVIAFLRGAPSEQAPQQAAEPGAEPQPVAETAPDPLTALADRVVALEAQIETLTRDLQAARTAADDAALAASEASNALGALKTGSADRSEAEAGLKAELEALQGRIDELAARQAVAGGSGSGAAINEALLSTIGALRERIVVLEAQEKVSPSDLSAVASRIDSAESGAGERIASLEAELSAVRQIAEKRAPEREQAGLLLLAVGQLEAVTITSASFDGQLAAVKDLATGGNPAVDDAVAVLDRHSAGVDTISALTERFDGMAKAVSQAKIAGSDEGLVGKTLNKVASLVTVRRTDVAEGPGVDAVLVRAETALDAGDLSGAVSALEELSGPPAERAGDWIAAAKARLAVDGAVSQLRGAALSSVAKAG
ncbi:COG4223 family protein [Nisaea sediminum]|uniref:COG4223 family protein n=1 Tax=Nisaea sediminum TaxID=2775867 RepID=UPI00186907E2|nr:mitofilin family membrane protein [Nisaea sediminum]